MEYLFRKNSEGIKSCFFSSKPGSFVWGFNLSKSKLTIFIGFIFSISIFLSMGSLDFLISINACISNGAWAGTDITIPLPSSMVTKDAGRMGLRELVMG